MGWPVASRRVLSLVMEASGALDADHRSVRARLDGWEAVRAVAAKKHATRKHPTQVRAATATTARPSRTPPRTIPRPTSAQRHTRGGSAPQRAAPAAPKIHPASNGALARAARAKGTQRRLAVPTDSTARVSWAMLVTFFQSGWLISTTLVGLALGFLLFWRPGGATYIFTTASFAYGLLAVATAALLVRSLHADAPRQPALTAMGRRAFVRGLALTMAALEVATVALLLAALLLFGRIQDGGAGIFFAGAVGLLANCVALGVLVGALLGVMTQRFCIVALAWLVAGLWSYSAHPPLRDILFVARLPLIPFGTLYNAGATGAFGWRGALALLCEAGLIALLLWVTPFVERPTPARESIAGWEGPTGRLRMRFDYLLPRRLR